MSRIINDYGLLSSLLEKILDLELTIDQVLKKRKLILNIKDYCNEGKIVILKKIFSENKVNNILKNNYIYFKKLKPIVPNSL